MLRNMISFHTLATAAVEKTSNADAGNKITFNVIKSRLSGLLYKLTSQKFEEPQQGEEVLSSKYAALGEELVDAFRALEDEYR